MITYGSLFSGVGLLDLGVEKAFEDCAIPLRCAWQCEINPFGRAVLAKHWPEVTRYEDVTRIGSTGAALAAVDLIVGGFPCQDISLAGKGAGLAGERSGLWFEYLRLIQELKTKAIIAENVGGLVRRGLDVVVAGLEDAGYEVEAAKITASEVGAPHRRERIFIVANAASSPSSQRRPAKSECGSTHQTFGSERHGPQLYVCGGWRTGESGMDRGAHGRANWLDGVRWPAGRGAEQYEWEPPRTTEKGLLNRAHRLKALGNGVVPQCAYVAARRVIEKLSA